MGARRTTVIHYVLTWLPLLQSFVYEPIARSRHPSVVASKTELENVALYRQRHLRSLAAVWPRRLPLPDAVVGAWLTALALAHRANLVHVHFGYQVREALGTCR